MSDATMAQRLTIVREALQAVLAARPDVARRTVVDIDPLSVL